MNIGNKKPYLVTGGGGFLGKAIVRKLRERNEIVRSFSRSHYPELASMGVEQICGDIADPVSVHRACKGVAAVFHVAAMAGIWGTYEAFYNANVTGTSNVINACRDNGVERLVHTSSPSVVFDGSDMEGIDESAPYPNVFEAHYPKTKALAEQAVMDAAGRGLPAVALRPHLIWGPGDNHLVPRILARWKRLRQIGDGGNLVDTIYIDNAADAHLLAERQLARTPEISGRIYFISQDDPIPVWEMINAILKAGGKPPVTKKISPKTAYRIGVVCETVYKLLGIRKEPPMTRFVARELATSHWFNIQAAKTDLGYRPTVSTAQGLERLAQWLRGRA